MKELTIGDYVKITNKAWRSDEFYIGIVNCQWPDLTMTVLVYNSIIKHPSYSWDFPILKSTDTIEILSDGEAMLLKLENS